MRIYSMTATFGKLENETLTLKPGLNVVHAPNEWGKSTWCGFLAAMLYGMDTRAKSTKASLADKERYAPWSGSPMEGRIELNWQGRDITIERKTKRRVPLGEFRAYETQTGIDIPELTAANCGEELLGVERSVFLRSGFIRFNDLPVTQDEALRRRLNALVTTGDESSTGDKLAGALRDLKNRCRYHKSGLLPQAEAERDELEGKIRELEAYALQSESLNTRLGQVKQRLVELENHKVALQYQAAQADAEQVARVEQARNEARLHLEAAKEKCADLPPREQTDWALKELRKLEQQWLDLQMEAHMAPKSPEPVAVPAQFPGMSGEEAITRAAADSARYEKLKKVNWLLPVLAGALVLAGGVLAIWSLAAGLILAGIGGAALIALLAKMAANSRKAGEIAENYGSEDPESWLLLAKSYSEDCRDYEQAQSRYLNSQAELDGRMGLLRQKIAKVTHDRGLESCRRDWEGVAAAWEELTAASREQQRWEQQLQVLRAMAKTSEKPAFPDMLRYTEAETARLLSDALAEQHMLQNRLGQYQGRMEQLGRREALLSQLERVNGRIAQLEQSYAALTLAQETLTEASAQLQRRFAPRIASRAQELMAAFTGGRYDRLTLGEDLSVRAGTGGEATTREAMWRSDGTVDQLYLALRLAVAEVLTPEAPLILDDALVRFDDARTKAALEVLRSVGENRQIILFTCHEREQNMI